MSIPLISGWSTDNTLRNNPISNFIFGGGSHDQPGPGGQIADDNYQDRQNLVQDPSTGYYFNPRTGASYTDPYGKILVTNPNVAQQVAQNWARSQSFLNKLGPLDQRQDQTFNNQNVLAQHLQDVISGKAPSLAVMQGQVGANNIADQQLSQAASVGGPSSPLASLAAMRNTGSAQTAANNEATIARTKEANDANTALGTLLNQQNQGISSARDSALAAALGFTNTANSGETSQQGLNQKSDSERGAQDYNFGMGALKFASSLG